MPPELKERLLQDLREQGRLPPDLDDEQTDRLMETSWAAAQALGMACREFIQAALEILRPAMEAFCDHLWRLMQVVTENLPQLDDCIYEMLKPRPKLPHPPKRLGAPRARAIIDRRPLTRHVRTTI